MARNLRNLKFSEGQRLEEQLVIERIGEHSLRNIEVMIRALLFKGTTEKAAVFEGLEVTSSGGMNVNASIPASCVQRLDNNDLKFGFDDRSFYSLTLDVGEASNRRDIIEAQISRRECFLDGNVDTIDSETKVITTGSRNRDYETIIDCRVRKGTSTTPPVSSSGTHGSLTGTVEHGSTLDMHEDYMLSIAVFEGEFTTLDFRGATPNATTRAEVVSRFAEVGITASFDASGHLIITEESLTGENSCFRIKDSRSSHDAFIALFGGSPLANYHNVYRGDNPWFKIAEIDVNSGVSSVSDANIRPLSARELWVSESSTVFVTTQIIKYVTDKIDEAITGLVGGAPGALDTLNELAAALGNDDDFATTVTNALTERYTKTEADDRFVHSAIEDIITGLLTFNRAGELMVLGDGTSTDSYITFKGDFADWRLKHVTSSTGGAEGNEIRIESVSTGRYLQMDHNGNIEYYDGTAIRTVYHSGNHTGHAASAISCTDEFANSNGTNVQDVLDDLDQHIENLEATTMTIGGLKTFSTIPRVNANPTNDNELARKAYVDTQSKNLAHPKDSYYVQYPANASNDEATAFPLAERPATLFGGTWDEVWDTEGVFFRTAGGNAESSRIDGKQEDALQDHDHYKNSDHEGEMVHDNSLGGTDPNTGANPISTYTRTGEVYTGRTANETRGVNRLIKVWKRTAW